MHRFFAALRVTLIAARARNRVKGSSGGIFPQIHGNTANKDLGAVSHRVGLIWDNRSREHSPSRERQKS